MLHKGDTWQNINCSKNVAHWGQCSKLGECTLGTTSVGKIRQKIVRILILIHHQTTRIVDFGPVGTIKAGPKSKCEQFDHHFFRKI